MNGSVLRQRLRRSDGAFKSPIAGLKVGISNNREYFSDPGDGADDHFNKSSHRGHHVSVPSAPSGSGSAVDSDDESDAALESQEGASSSASETPPLSPAWYEFDLSVMLALVSPIGNWLTGGDHVKNLLLILLLVFYLHQIIEVPWSLYLLSRPRRTTRAASPQDAPTEDRCHTTASTELRFLELFYLTLSVLSPFLGALLLRTVLVSVSGPSTISWFSTSLFVLATGMRPWRHAVERLRQRTADLRNVVQYPPSEAQKTQSQLEALVEKVTQLETELKSLKEQFKDFNTEVCEHVEDAIGVMERAMRKQEKKMEATRTSFEARMMKSEQDVDVLLERREIRANGPTFYGVSTFFSTLTDQLSPMLPAWATLPSRNKGLPSPRYSPKMGRPRSGSKLETIPELATFQLRSSRHRFSYLRIPGMGIALRIGDLATLPVRRVIAYLLAGRIYTPRQPASSS
ncbi:hypothetical protein BU15DRAFT_88321 [Melanogaster broomeanus]|nr:hypothetical protein BU15DRAFT_88321 [Melanogaster broomeanus]